MPVPANQTLYDEVKLLADKKFLAPTSAYKSAWIIAEYKRRGGIYLEDGKPRNLTKWFLEKWVDLERPRHDARGRVTGYETCGRPHADGAKKGKYPLCRPSVKVDAATPLTVREVTSNKALSLERIEKDKQRVREKGRVTFAAPAASSRKR